MDQSSVVADHAVSTDKHVVSDGVSEHFNAKGISDDFFGLLVEIRVNECYVIVAGDAVTKS